MHILLQLSIFTMLGYISSECQTKVQNVTVQLCQKCHHVWQQRSTIWIDLPRIISRKSTKLLTHGAANILLRYVFHASHALHFKRVMSFYQYQICKYRS